MYLQQQITCKQKYKMYNKKNQKLKRKMQNLRLNKFEQEAIRRKSIEINKKLVEKGKAPLKESELLHKILKKAIKKTKLDENSEITIEQ